MMIGYYRPVIISPWPSSRRGTSMFGCYLAVPGTVSSRVLPAFKMIFLDRAITSQR